MPTNPEDDDPSGGSASIDTALLESLFYNEMMLIDDTSSLLSSSLFSSLSADFASPSSSASASASLRQMNGSAPTSHPTSSSLSHFDPSTIAEKALLRHFGVSGETPVPPDDNAAAATASQQQSGLAPSPLPPLPPPVLEEGLEPTLPRAHGGGAHYQGPSWMSSASTPTPSAGAIVVDPNFPGSYATSSGPIDAAAAIATATAHNPGGPPESVLHAPFQPHPPPPAAGAAGRSPAHLGAAVPHEKLVSQFATLASRLGIRVPPHLVQALLNNEGDGRTADAVAAFASGASSYEEHANKGGGMLSTMATGSLPTAAAEDPASAAAASAAAAAPAAVQELENVAKAAIAAVAAETQRKRPGSDEDRAPVVPSETSAAAAAASSSSKAPAYSKRRKKPRLADCETKLAQLQAENDLLKRHLTTISNQSHKIDSERKELEKKMRTMLETGATPQEMDRLVQTFSDYYSDYGRRRHQELEFHLEQLQRLANPTNFTKMGLWTLGQQSSNPRKDPIASILQKELGITPQQGKKIIEQRQKIRDVCTNLSECLTLLSKLKGLCEQKTKIFNDRMEKCREILSPRQVIKLLIWIDEHSSVLGKVCPGWGSEQIPTKPKKG